MQSVPAEYKSVSFDCFANQLQINEWGFIQMSAFVFLKLQFNINIHTTSLLTNNGATSRRASVFAFNMTVPKSAVDDYAGWRCSRFAVDSLLSKSKFAFFKKLFSTSVSVTAAAVVHCDILHLLALFRLL